MGALVQPRPAFSGGPGLATYTRATFTPAPTTTSSRNANTSSTPPSPSTRDDSGTGHPPPLDHPTKPGSTNPRFRPTPDRNRQPEVDSFRDEDWVSAIRDENGGLLRDGLVDERGDRFVSARGLKSGEPLTEIIDLIGVDAANADLKHPEMMARQEQQDEAIVKGAGPRRTCPRHRCPGLRHDYLVGLGRYRTVYSPLLDADNPRSLPDRERVMALAKSEIIDWSSRWWSSGAA